MSNIEKTSGPCSTVKNNKHVCFPGTLCRLRWISALCRNASSSRPCLGSTSGVLLDRHWKIHSGVSSEEFYVWCNVFQVPESFEKTLCMPFRNQKRWFSFNTCRIVVILLQICWLNCKKTFLWKILQGANAPGVCFFLEPVEPDWSKICFRHDIRVPAEISMFRIITMI